MTAEARVDPPPFPLVTDKDDSRIRDVPRRGRRDQPSPTPTVQLSNWAFSLSAVPSPSPISWIISPTVGGYRRARLPSLDKYHRHPRTFRVYLAGTCRAYFDRNAEGNRPCERARQYIPSRMIENYSAADARIPISLGTVVERWPMMEQRGGQRWDPSLKWICLIEKLETGRRWLDVNNLDFWGNSSLFFDPIMRRAYCDPIEFLEMNSASLKFYGKRIKDVRKL